MFTHVSNLKRSSMNPGACSICLHMCRVLPRKNPQSGTRFDKVCHIAVLEGIMLEGILFYAELGSKGQKPLILNNILNCLVCRSKSLFKNVK